MKILLKLKDSPLMVIEGDSLIYNHGHVFSDNNPIIQFKIDILEYIVWDSDKIFDRIDVSTKEELGLTVLKPYFGKL